MKAGKHIARWVAVLLILQLAAGPLVNFALLGPVNAAPPGFLANAPMHATQVSLAALIGFGASVMTVGIAVALWPLVRGQAPAMSLSLLAFAVVGLALSAVENAGLLTMLSLSQEHATANAADESLYQGLAFMVGSARRWVHFMNLIVGGGLTYSAFYALLYRLALVPRGLAATGFAAAALLLVAVAMPLFGFPVAFLLLVPLGLAHLVLSVWLLLRGFVESPIA